MSQVEVDKVIPQSGTTLTIGDSGDTINLVGTLQSNGSPLPGDISSVVAGTGLSGGGTTGAVTLNIDSAQPTITSTGTLTGFTSTGIDDNASGTSLTIASDGRTTLDATNEKAFVVHHSDGSNVRIGMNNNTTNSNEIAYEGTDFVIKPGGTEKARLTSTGLGIGTSAPDAKLQVTSASSSVTPNGNADELFVEGSGNSGITIGSGTANAGQLCFGDSGDNDIGAIAYLHDVNAMRFTTSGIERARFLGNTFMVGKTAGSGATNGVELKSNDESRFTQTSRAVIAINRLSSDGNIVELKKDNTLSGQIAVLGNRMNIGTGNTALRYDSNSRKILPWDVSTNSGTGVDAAIDLGAAGGYRFKDIYLSGGAFIGGTGTSNKLDDYEQGTFTPVLEFGNATTGITYNNRDGMYVKVGELVMIQIFIELSNKGSASGDATISGLPFTMRTLSNGWSGVGAGSMTWTNFASRLYSILTNPNRNTQELGISGVSNSSGELSAQALNSGDFNNNTYFGITVSYRTT